MGKKFLYVLIVVFVMSFAISSGIPVSVRAQPAASGQLQMVGLKSAATNKFVCAESGGTVPMLINRDGVGGDWEKFQKEDLGNGLFSLKSMANSRYVTVDTAAKTLMPSSTTAGDAQKFTMEDRGSGKYAIKAVINNMYLSNDIAAGNQLHADAVTIGPNEEFIWFNLDPIPSATSDVGVTMGFTTTTLNGGTPEYAGNTIYNLPLYMSSSDTSQWWDNIVEEIAYSGADFVAPTIRGYLDSVPDYNNNGDPRKLADMVAAMNRRGVADKFKISFLDDTAASMADHKNRDNGGGGYDPKFDIGDTGNYKYIWDYNMRAFFNAVPDNMRYKIDGRPAIWEWGIGDYAFTNYGNGNTKALLMYIREKCQAEFGFNPYIIVDQSWVKCDPSVNNPAVIDGIHGWFILGPGYSTENFNGNSFGALCPAFRVVNGSASMFLDSNHGKTFDTNLSLTAGKKCLSTLVEGFSDWEENCSVWRSKDTTYYDYPNQRINILRKYTKNPFPDDLKVEAEACDSYNDTTAGNSGNSFRDGNIDIQRTSDVNGGWNVYNTSAGEWLQWQEIPLQGTVTLKARISTNTQNARLRFVIDGTAGPTITLPDTGGLQNWQTVDAGTFTFEQGSYHTVKIEFISGNIGLNYWTN